MREFETTLTPTLSLAEREGATSIPSPPEGESDRGGGVLDVAYAFVNSPGYGRSRLSGTKSRWGPASGANTKRIASR